MTDKQWNDLKDIVNGKILSPPPVGFIIDSPWLPNWYGISIRDYFSNDDLWFRANQKAMDTFPEIMFFPGFWSEYGMCSEPSAFGARCSFPPNEFPHVHKSIFSVDEIKRLTKPNPKNDGLAPFLINRLLINQKRIEDSGHKIRFSVSRGPLNIASYLMGTTELLTAIMMNPDEIHKLLDIITEYLCEWHELQIHTFPTIDGIMVLDDIIGFMGEEEFKEFGLPYFKNIFNKDVSIKFLHNDADCNASIKYLPEMGINMFNMAYDTSLNDLKVQTNQQVVMLGNIPPRDVLANGTENDIKNVVKTLIKELEDPSRVIFSCGGGIPPNVSTKNIKTFYNQCCHT